MACTLYWTVPQLYRLTIILSPQLPRFCMDMIGIHFVCCFFSTHKSQANPQLASTTCQCVCVCSGLQQRSCVAAVPHGSASLGGVLCLCLCLLSLSVLRLCLPSSLSCLLYVVAVVLSVCLIKLLNLTFSLCPM